MHLLSSVSMPLNQSMHNDVSGLSSQGLDSWLSYLTAQVPELAALRSGLEHTGTAGYYHTLREICQQPLTWLDTSARVSDSLVRLREIMAASGLERKARRSDLYWLWQLTVCRGMPRVDPSTGT